MKRIYFLVIAVFMALAINLESAGVPQVIAYQGRLTDGSGNPVADGDYLIRLQIYDDPAAGAVKWTDGIRQISVTNGLFTYQLGDSTALPNDLFANDTGLWLGLKVGADPEITPRTKMTSYGFAYQALRADTAEFAVNILGGGSYLPLAGGTMTGPITSSGNPSITMGKGNFGNSNTNTGAEAFVAGANNSASGSISTIGGGAGNSAMGSGATVSGGGGNLADSVYSTVGGGSENFAIAELATIGGGGLNVANGLYATIGGGHNNIAGFTATVGGGNGNIAESSWVTISGGIGNIGRSRFATIGGGVGNIMNGPSSYGSTISGGGYNIVSDSFGVIAGGKYNRVSGFYGTVSGGGGPVEADSNSASGIWSTVSGGSRNYASGPYTTISGGNANIANDWHATVSGGEENSAAQQATVGGGFSNTASEIRATIAGGFDNLASGDASTIGGGRDNLADDTATTVAGGRNNRARGWYAAIGGGGGSTLADSNSAFGDWSTVSGGRKNSASGERSTVAGGHANIASGALASVGGGIGNGATGSTATVAGGFNNYASGGNSFIGGGVYDSATGENSTVPGGAYNKAAGDYSFAAGRRSKANHSGTFVWGDNTNADFASTAVDQFLIRAGGGVGIGTNSPSGVLHVANSEWNSNPVRISGLSGSSVGPTLLIDASNGTGGRPYNIISTNSSAGAGGGKLAIYDPFGGYRMVIDSFGNVGIGANSPGNKLDVEASGAVVADFNRTANDGVIINLQQAGTTEGTISVSGTTVSYNAFTGSHYGWTEERLEKGELVSLTGENRFYHNNLKSEIIYGIKMSNHANDPACLGSYLSISESTQPASENNPYLIMAVGNGVMWVTDESGDIKPGDYLISSSTPGHAMKDDEEKYAIGHIVARAAESVDWSSVAETIEGRKHKKISVLFGNFVRSNAAELKRTVSIQQKQLNEQNDRIARLEASMLRSQAGN